MMEKQAWLGFIRNCFRRGRYREAVESLRQRLGAACGVTGRECEAERTPAATSGQIHRRRRGGRA